MSSSCPVRAIRLAVCATLLALSLVDAHAASYKAMLLVEEKSLGTIATAEVEALAVRLLGEKGIATVDQDMVRANQEKTRAALKSAGDARGAAALGREFGADVVIVGEAVAKPSARRIADSGLRSYEAVVTLRAVRTDNALNIASASETAAIVAMEDVSGGSRALKAAGQAALNALIPAVETRMAAAQVQTGAAAQPVELDLTVGGVDQVWKLKAVREALRGRSDVSEVTQRSYAQGLARFSLKSQLPAEELAEALVVAPPDGLRMQVVETTAAALTLRVVEQPVAPDPPADGHS